ncbi:MAG: prepilin-type N-terminal cleavage/methylation domain-containing protein, partial [bacterium]|nr:prepilin-type N-terminal cleavage/methylation domain-containing protein [bacterium]
MKNKRGYTLVELIISVGLFALIMMLASGAYFVMININRQAQGIATGINNLSFALETMTRTIRTGTNYSCNSGGDCQYGGINFSVISSRGIATNYSLSSGTIIQNGVALTDPSINISSLIFYVSGTSRNDDYQPRVTIVVSGTISPGPSSTESCTIETGATMRGID